jgi:hypothetical protein
LQVIMHNKKCKKWRTAATTTVSGTLRIGCKFYERTYSITYISIIKGALMIGSHSSGSHI